MEEINKCKNHFWVGIDYSVSSPAMCLIADCCDGTLHPLLQFHFFFAKQKQSFLPLNPSVYKGRKYPIEYSHSIERYHELATPFVEVLRHWISKDYTVSVVLEDYAFSALGRITMLAEATGILKYRLGYELGIVPDQVTSSKLKKFATGSGNAKKWQMVQAFKQQTRLDIFSDFGLEENKVKTDAIPTPITDIADAYHLACWARNITKD